MWNSMTLHPKLEIGFANTKGFRPLPVYRSDAADSDLEQVGTLRIRGLEAPLDSRGLGKSELQDNFRVWCAARC